jgi:PAS domain S-box-containing protein
MEIEAKQNLHDKRLFMNMVQNNWLAVVFANMDNIVEYVNPAACELYGYEEHELIGQTTEIFNSNLSHSTDNIVKSIKEKGYWFGEIIQQKKNQTHFDSLLSVQLILNENGEPIGFASNSKDISLELETERSLKNIIAEKELLLKINTSVTIMLSIKKPAKIAGFYSYKSKDYLTVTLANLRLPTWYTAVVPEAIRSLLSGIFSHSILAAPCLIIRIASDVLAAKPASFNKLAMAISPLSSIVLTVFSSISSGIAPF